MHVYNPIPGESLFVDLTGTGYPMTPVAGNWLTFTIPSTIQNHVNKLGVRSSYSRQPNSIWIARTGIASGGADAFTLEDFAGGNELWIIIDPSGPATARPKILTQPPRMVHILNPWRLTAPVVVLPGGRKSMLTVSDRCGWFLAYLLEPTDTQVSFAEVTNAGFYGRDGLGSTQAFDLAAEFSSKGPSLWLDTELNTWYGAWPNKDDAGGCKYLMAATVRDFRDAHPDFNPSGSGNIDGKGMVSRTLGADNKPVASGLVSQTMTRFTDWFNTTDPSVSADLRNYETCIDIPMGKTNDGMWEFDSYANGSPGFFPIEDFVNPNNERNQACAGAPNYTQVGTRNMNFCMEAHAKFRYRKGQTFSFRGDDDVWVFINKKLVIDLGGIHIALSDSVLLDTLGLVEGQEYPWDFFYCERKACGSSLRVKTSIFFEQKRALDTVMLPDPNGILRAKVIKRVGGNGSCDSNGDSVRVVDATNLVYQLWTAAGQVVDSTLKDGSFHNGGIVIATPNISVDTAKITTLPPGNYRIVAFEASSRGVRAEVPFTIKNRSWVQFEPNQDATVQVGTLVPVVAANRNGTDAPAGAMNYTFQVNTMAGVRIFEDAAGTRPIALTPSGTAAATGPGATGADGLDTIWVGGDPNAAANMTYVLATQNSTRSVRLTFTLPPLFVPRLLTATVHDDNADGIGDRIVATYDSSIEARLPKRITYQWPASGTAAQVDSAGLVGKAAGAVLTLSGLALTTDRITSGQGTFTSVYPARGSRDTTQSVPLQDRIAPILVTAIMIPGLTQDTLRLTFSEPVGEVKAASADLFVYRLNLDGADIQYAPTALNWKADRTGADLLFPAGATEAPRSGNFVRIMDGPDRIADALGNAPGANSLFRLIGGQGKPEIKTVTLHTIDPSKLLPGAPTILVSLQPKNADVQNVVTETGRLGHLIKVDLGEHAQSDGLNPNVNPDNVALTYEVSYFTNHGVPVASEKRTITCKDPLFGTGSIDCRSNRRYIFVGWDFTTTLKKQRVATGAYIARLRYKVTGGMEPVQGGLDQTWGVIRGN